MSLTLVISAVAGALVAEIYSQGRVAGIPALDSAILSTAQVIGPYVDRRPSFAKEFQEKLVALLPDLRRYTQSGMGVHVLTQAEPLPLPSAPEFEWAVVERWCNWVPGSDEVYRQTTFRVTNLYEGFLRSIDFGTDSAKGIAILTKQLSAVLAKESDLLTHADDEHFEARLVGVRRERDRVLREIERLAGKSGPSKAEAVAFLRFYRSMGGTYDPSGRYVEAKPCRTVPSLAEWLEKSANTNEGEILAEGPASFYLVGERPEFGSSDSKLTLQLAGLDLQAQTDPVTAGKEVATGTTLSLSVQRAQIITLDRSPWFDQELIKKYWLGPWRGGESPILASSPDARRVPVALLVVYNPQFTLSIRGDLAEALEQLEAVGGTIGVGPIQMAVGPSELNARIQKLDDRTAHIYYGPSRAYVLAVISGRLPDVTLGR